MFYDAATYELQNMCSIGLRGLMLWQQLTLTLFLVLEMHFRDILKITPLVKLALISFMDVIYQSYVKLHWVIFIM